MTTIRTEEWNGHQIRFVQHKDEWWAIAKDVASALGYNHTPSMVRMLDQDEKGVHIMHTPGGNQKMTIISETGIYEAIWNSRKPEAKDFKSGLNKRSRRYDKRPVLKASKSFACWIKNIKKK